MRALRKLFSIAVPVAVVACMAVPAAALAGPSGWYDEGNPLGSWNADPDQVVTLQVSGNIQIESISKRTNCQITGEIEVWNEYPGSVPVGHNRMTDLDLAGNPATVCDYRWLPSPSCYPSSMTFDDLPWTGESDDFTTRFDDATIYLNWVGGAWCGFQSVDTADFQAVPTVQSGDCIEEFEIPVADFGTLGNDISGTLQIDDFDGLAPGSGDCLSLME